MSGLSVVGRSCRLPGANNIASYWDLLKRGRCSVTQVPTDRFSQSPYANTRRGERGKSYTFAAGVIDDIWGFDPGVFAITPREARQMDPQQRLLLQLVWEALEDAGVKPGCLSGENVGVYIGASTMDHSHRQFFDPAGTDPYMMTGNTLSVIANRISYIFDLAGPSLTIDTACSSSLVALVYALRDLENGRVDRAVVGGVNALLSPFNFIGFSAASMLSPDGLCRPFDHRANGYVRSEGGVVMLLERSGENRFGSVKNYGDIVTASLNSDGRTPGVALPSSNRQAELLKTIYLEGAINPGDLAFVEAHGTGTQVGDPAEAHALGTVLGQNRSHPLPIGSSKSNVGHLEPASGLVGLLKAQLALEHGLLPPTLHVEAPNPSIDFDDLNLAVATAPITWDAVEAKRGPHRLAGVNNFGFGGTNVHVVLRAPSNPPVNANDLNGVVNGSTRHHVNGQANGHLINVAKPAGQGLTLLSAQCAQALRELAGQYRDLIASGQSNGRSNVASGVLNSVGSDPDFQRKASATARPEDKPQHTVARFRAAAAHRRDWLRERLVLIGDDPEEITDALSAFLAGDTATSFSSATAVASQASTALVFSGAGAQWDGMGRRAFETSPRFKKHFSRISEAYGLLSGSTLEQWLYADDLSERLQRTEMAQPLLFAIQAAIARSLIEAGLRPSATLGHSFGEVAAAHITGALTLPQAVTIIKARSQSQEPMYGLGAMAAVQSAAPEALAVAHQHGLDSVEIAAINSSRSITVTGTEDDIRALIKALRAKRIAARQLDITYPFHSALIAPAREPLLDHLAGLRPKPGEMTFISTVSGQKTEGTALDCEYWWRNVRQPVRFTDAVAAAAAEGCQLFVEISPRPILRNYILDTLAQTDVETSYVSTLTEKDLPGRDPLRDCLGRLVASGARVDAETVFGRNPTGDVPLPSYPWQNTEYRLSSSREAFSAFTQRSIHPLLGMEMRQGDGIWDNHLDTGVVDFLDDHRINGQVIMPGAAFVEMALAATAAHLETVNVEIRDFDLLQALPLSDASSREVRTTLDKDTKSIEIASRPRLSGGDRNLHVKARFAALADQDTDVNSAPAAPSWDFELDGPPLWDRYRLAAQFGLDYGPVFQRMCACREIGDKIIEVGLNERRHADRAGALLHLDPVDFDSCLHGLSVIYERLAFGENKLAFVPVRIGALKLHLAGEPVRTARIHLKSYNPRSAAADMSLFSSDGRLIATISDIRLRAANLVHRKNLDQSAYHFAGRRFALSKEEPVHFEAELLDRLKRVKAAAESAVMPPAQTGLEESRLLIEAAAWRVALDVVSTLARADGRVPTADAIEDPPTAGGARDDDRAQPAETLVKLLDILERAELASCEGGVWRLASADALPPLSEIIQTVLANSPAWSAECLMLLGARRHLGTHLESLTHRADGKGTHKDETAVEPITGPDNPRPDNPRPDNPRPDNPRPDNTRAAETAANLHGSATLDHFHAHAPIARSQIARVTAAIAAFVDGRGEQASRPLRILQLGAGCPTLTQALLNLRCRSLAALTIADPDDTRLRRHSHRFQSVPVVQAVHLESASEISPRRNPEAGTITGLLAAGPFDVIVSVGALAAFEDPSAVLRAIRPYAATDAAIVLSERLPDAFHSVAFATTVEAPKSAAHQTDQQTGMGLRTIGEWQALFEDAGIALVSESPRCAGNREHGPAQQSTKPEQSSFDCEATVGGNEAAADDPPPRGDAVFVGRFTSPSITEAGAASDMTLFGEDAHSVSPSERRAPQQDGLRAGHDSSVDRPAARSSESRAPSSGPAHKVVCIEAPGADGDLLSSIQSVLTADDGDAEVSTICCDTMGKTGVHLDQASDIVFCVGARAADGQTLHMNGSAPDQTSQDCTAETCDVRALTAASSDFLHLIRTIKDRVTRLWVVLPGGARATLGLGEASPVNTGLWSLARTARNERPGIDIRLIDHCAALDAAAAGARIAALITRGCTVTEGVIAEDDVIGLELHRGAPPFVPAAPELTSRTSASVAAPAHGVNADPSSQDANAATVLAISQPGDFARLGWQRRTRRAPDAGEVEIAVAATGLNFRDVMWSMGLLPEEALEGGFAGPTIGFECAGHIVAVGETVEGLAVGDRVIAMAPAAFASHVTVSCDAVAALPDDLPLEEAASIPVAFLTASYGLEHLANVQAGEWVLVHGAAGGVGLAALQIAKRAGANVIATAGTPQKRELARALGADHVLDSRSLSFAENIRSIIPEGVDIVLNSLASDAMERSIELLRPFGRFLELGKRDFYANTKVGLRPLRRNVSYFGIDADQLLTHRRDVVRRTFSDLTEAFADGALTPLPCRIFDSHEVVEAFRLMQQSGHVGKIIVRAPPAMAGKTAVVREFRAAEEGAHLIVGGTGGFGLEMARWLADRGARHIVLASRSGKGGEALDRLEHDLSSRGVRLQMVACDATDADALANVLDDLRSDTRIAGIAHTAMVLDDALIEDLTPERIRRVLDPKVAGAANLDRLTRFGRPDYFLLFSSAAAVFGNPGQASYNAANGYLDGLAAARAAAGYHALSVAWGAISDVGILAREEETAKSLSRHTGDAAFTARTGLELLAALLVRDDIGHATTHVALAEMNWALAGDMLPIMATPTYDMIRRGLDQRGQDTTAGTDLIAEIGRLNDADARGLVCGHLTREVAAIFRMPAEDINVRRPLADIGMDSLMGLELRMAVQRSLGVEIPMVSLSDGTTVNDIAGRIVASVRADEGSGGGDAAGSADTERAVMLDKHIDDDIDAADLDLLEQRVIERETALEKII